MEITGSTFRDLYQPSECHRKRVWLRRHSPELASPPSAFDELVNRRGCELEERYIATLSGVSRPTYPVGDLTAGLGATLELVNQGSPAIRYPVLVVDGVGGIPDLLIRDGETGRYEIRDVKLATHPENHVSPLSQRSRGEGNLDGCVA